VKQPSVAHAYYAVMVEKGFQPSTITYNILLNVCSLGGDAAGARLLWKDFKKTGLKPDRILYLALMHALGPEPDKDKVR
jgi:pentatricopeptide repeat protein